MPGAPVFRFQLTARVDADAVRRDASSDGCFPLISNDHDLTDSDVLIAYRYQPNLEKRHHQLKSVQDAAPVTLKSPARIEALVERRLNPARGTAVVPLVAGMALAGLAGFARS